MSTKKQKERKKKKREEIAKSRVLSRRNYLRKKNSEENKANILDRKFRNKLSPIVKDESKKEEIKKNKDEKIISKLEKNLEILKALEEQYLQEQKSKQDLNKSLEDDGYVTLNEKMGELEKRVKDHLKIDEDSPGHLDVQIGENS